MGQDNQCCSTEKMKRVRDEEKDSEIDTESNMSGISNIENNNGLNLTKMNEESFIDSNFTSDNSYDKLREKKIILIQSYYKMYYFRGIFLDLCEQKKKNALKELNKYIVSKEMIKNHKGEILHKTFKKMYPKAIYNFKNPSYLKYNCFTIKELINYYPNEYYLGSWNNKKLYEGYGELYINDKNSNKYHKYEGIFKNGKLENFGYGIFPEREIIYLGTWENNLTNGKGQEIYIGNNKEIPYLFNGKFLNGSKIYGSLFYKDGSFYEGGFNHYGKFNGKGKYFWAKTKIKYEGDWFNDKMNGQGKMFYTDGSVYEGSFVNNINHGFGTYVWKGKEPKIYYVGEFKNDVMDGKGKLVSGNNIMEGIWKNGQFVK